MITAEPAPDLVDRFRRDLAALEPSCTSLGIAVSGGPDSIALLLLAAAAFPNMVCAATVDHGLRAEAIDEARFVATLCASLHVPHQILRADVDTGRASLQRAAREARYRILHDWLAREGIGLLATAHHADDQAETLLMRLLRGAGVGGLSGVRARTRLPAPASDIVLIRPMLGWRRAELASIVNAAGIDPVADPSNRDPRYDRVRIRQELVTATWLDPIPLARSAAALAEADAALAWTADRLYSQRVRATANDLTFAPEDVPDELRRRILRGILTTLCPGADPRGEELGRLLHSLEGGTTATLAGVKCTGGSIWRFSCAPPHRRST